MNKEVIGILLISMGIISIYVAMLQQTYVMMTGTYTLNHFKDKELVRHMASLFTSFSLTVYLLCPNSRERGIVFFILEGGSATMCLLARIWLPFNK